MLHSGAYGLESLQANQAKSIIKTGGWIVIRQRVNLGGVDLPKRDRQQCLRAKLKNLSDWVTEVLLLRNVWNGRGTDLRVYYVEK